MSKENNIDRNNNIFIENITELMSPEGVQKYILGTKKNGTPRALYDVLKDYSKPKKKKKKKGGKNKKNDIPTSYSLYLSTSSNKKQNKKKKNKKKKDKHWHI